MKKFAQWLEEHAVVPGDSTKATISFIVSLIIAAVTIILFAALGWRDKEIEYLLGVLVLGACIGLPLFEALRALVTKKPWTPWYWFPSVAGVALGGFLAMFVSWIFGWYGL